MLLKVLLVIAFVNLVKSFKVTFWVITDIHLNLTNASTLFGDYLHDSPISLVNSSIEAMKLKYPNPDFIIWNGDNAAHVDLTKPEFFESIRIVTSELKRQFGAKLLLPSVGNHDVNPRNNLDPQSDWCKLMFSEWNDVIRPKESESFKRGCYYSRLVAKKLRVIVLNTVLWMMANKITKNGTDPADQFRWLEKQLMYSQKAGEKVFLVGHIPPGASEFSPIKYVHLHEQYNDRFVDIMENYSDIIQSGFFSHEHVDAFRIVYNQQGEPKFPILLSPSVSPIHLSNLGSPNPAIRLYNWSSSNSSYSQFHTIIPASPQSSLSWSKLYDSRSVVPSLSGAHMHSLLSSFYHNNSRQYASFLNRHLSGRPHDIDCSVFMSRCYCLLMCGLRFLRHASLTECTNNCSNTPDITTTTGTTTIFDIGFSATSANVSWPYINPTSNTSSSSSKTQITMIAIIIVVFTVILVIIVFCANKIYCKQRRTASLTRDMHLASYNGKEAHDIMEEHIDNIVESTFGDVPEYRGHFRQNSRTLLTPKDTEDIAMAKQKKAASNSAQLTLSVGSGVSNEAAIDDNSASNNGAAGTLSKFMMSHPKSHEKYDYQRM